MKIGGIAVQGPAREVLVLPRLGENIVITAQAVLDMDPFNKMVPEPKAPSVLKKGGFSKNTDDPTYRQLVEKHGDLRFAYIAIKSLEPSEIEWARVNIDQPSTWLEWDKELREAGLSSVEVNRIVLCVMQANSLDERKLKEARELFLRGMEATEPKSSGPSSPPPNTQSGEVANDSESSLPV